MGREWNSTAYHTLSDPQFKWGLNVLGRLRQLPLHNLQHILDAGCGTGRVTAELMRAFPDVRVTAVDASHNMVEEARSTLADFGPRVTVRQLDLLELSAEQEYDLVFSTAVFHWIKDHNLLFKKIFKSLRPGGILFAQCGGGPNLERLRQRSLAARQLPEFERYFKNWQRVWEYPETKETADRLERAGFEDIQTSLETAPTQLPDEQTFRQFCAAVSLHPYLDRLPEELHDSFLDRISRQFAQDDPPFVLDYWRLNLFGRRGAT